ncbi:MAG: bifunctional diguanylate cyclase/phosphodiesterase [Lachnospiraceae bacterium]|nr:bifunctional diguanylate cyclase/phosphodiesterase [Lachnospiraceae bacterium]
MTDKINFKWQKSDIAVISGVIFCYIGMIIATFMGYGFFIKLFSSLTSFLTATTIMLCLKRMGPYWLPSFLLGVGIYMWSLGDIIDFVSLIILRIPRPDAIIDTIYLFPNYFYGASVAVYFIQKLKGRALYQFWVNVFALSVTGFVFLRKLLSIFDTTLTLNAIELSRVYLYFFINLFILIMMVHMVYMIAAESGLKGTNTMILGIFCYILLDLPYNYLAVIGANPENIWLNLVYMFCMMLMAHGIFHQIRHKHVFYLKEHEYDEKTMKRMRIMIFIGVIISNILFFTKLINQNDLFYLLIVMLAYWVSTASFQNGALNEQLIKQQDILTGLYNRRYSTKVLKEMVSRQYVDNETFCVYCIDLNRFKPINDTYGHDMGDRVLKEFGTRMLKLPNEYMSFRTGGDEFMVIRTGIKSEVGVETGARLLQKLFNTPLEFDSYVFRLSASIGAAIYKIHALNEEELLRFADAAMYVVKHSGKKDGFKLFDKALIKTVEEQRALEETLKSASVEKDFVLYYQPRVDIESSRVVGAEAFPRLKGKEDVLYTAAQIIPAAEETGLMSPLGIWIAETGVKMLVKRRENDPDFSIKINLSPLQLLDVDFIEKLKSLKKEYDIKPEQIRLDISNEVVMGADNAAKATLKELCANGFYLSLNDFGGGDINLSYILDCGFREIDISHSLIERGMVEPKAKAAIKSVIAIADVMEVTAAAVGIETERQADILKDMNITAMQGYYFGKPVPEEEFERLYPPGEKCKRRNS